jgi:hypothetical protein
MHRCLAIQDILRLICESFDPSGRSSSTLFALACTCHTFKEPALDYLWHTQTSLMPLFKCLPQDMWEGEGTLNGWKTLVSKGLIHWLCSSTMIILFCLRKSLRLVHQPVAGEWDRFESYARRIKTLSCRSGSGWHGHRNFQIIEQLMSEALADHFQKSPVLPNLRRLYCYEGAMINKYMGLFLAPRLTRLLFCPSTRSSPDPAVVESINTACPNLRTLDIRPELSFACDAHSLLASASTLIRSLSALESLHCEFPLSPATIIHLSRLPSLTEVSMFDHPAATARSLAGISAPAFAHLTFLAIPAWDGPSTANLLRALYLKNLEILNIIFYSPSDFRHHGALLKLYHPHAFNNYQSRWLDSSGLSQVFTAIQASCDGLQSLLTTSRRGAETTSRLSSPDIIVPLFSFRNLTSLRIDGVCQCDLDDVVLKEMANAWPLLQTLRCRVVRQNFQPKATLEGLAAIISGCSQLMEVYATIYVSAIQTSDIDVKEYNSNGSVWRLYLDTSLVDDDVNLVELAEVFAILCPKLTSFAMPPNSLWSILRNLLTTGDKTCQ